MQKVTGSKIGHLTWSLNKVKTLKELNHNELVEFRYYSGAKSNQFYANSIALKVIKPNISNTHCESNSSSSSSFESFSLNQNANLSQNEEDFLTFRINELKAAQLRKGMFFNPDPYVKISILSNTQSSLDNHQVNQTTPVSSTTSALPGSSIREYKTYVATNTCFPNWKNENFIIVARETDRIMFEVKDKFARTKPSINRFLGRVLVDIQTLIEKTRLNKG